MNLHGGAVARLGLYAGVLLIPTTLPWVGEASPHDVARMAQLLLAAFCSLAVVAAGPAIASRPAFSLKHLDPASRWAWLLLGLTLAGSVLHAAQPDWALRELALWAGMAAIAWLLAQEPQHSLRQLPWVLTASALLYAVLLTLLALAAVLGDGALPAPDVLVFGFNNYRFLNHTQTVWLPLLIGVAVAHPDARLRHLARWAAGLHWFWLLQLGGRATVLALVLSTAVLAVLFGRRAWPLVKAQLLLALAALALLTAAALAQQHVLPPVSGANSPVHAASPTPVVRGGSLTDDGARFYLWQHAWAQAWESPWLGSGPMHFSHYQAHPNQKAAHPHNVYLQSMAEMGVPFTLLALYLLARAAWRMQARVAVAARAEPLLKGCASAHMGMALLATWVAIAVDASFSGNLVMPVPQLWAALALGWWLAWARSQPDGLALSVHTAQGWDRYAVWTSTALACALACWVCVSALMEFQDLRNQLDAAREATHTAKWNPRFWSHGWF